MTIIDEIFEHADAGAVDALRHKATPAALRGLFLTVTCWHCGASLRIADTWTTWSCATCGRLQRREAQP